MKISNLAIAKPYLPVFTKKLVRAISAAGFLLAVSIAANAVTLWQNTDTTTIVNNSSISCNLAGSHDDNSYWRAFRPSTFGYTGTFTTTGIRFGIEESTIGGGGPNQPATVRIWVNTGGTFPAGTRTLLATAPITIAAGTLFFQDVNVSAPAQIGTNQILVEIFTPSGQAAGHRFFIGSNNAGETETSYIQAAGCGAPNPVTVAAAGGPNMHTLIGLVGTGTVATAAEASISGRVSTSGGNGIRNATVTLTLPSGEVRTVSTGSFGSYLFSDLPAGQSYVISLSAKRYRFANPTRIVTLEEDLTGMDFVANGE